MIDHDAIFKQLLTAFFVEFLDLFAPEVLALLDRASLTFLDKESFGDLVDPERREADLVVQAQLAGQTAYLIVHLEHQAQEDAAIHRRMFRYFARLYDRYDVPIYPIVLCSYLTPRTPVADRHQVAVGSFAVVDFRYQTVQLNRLDWRSYARNPNPLASALMARMRVASKERVQVKLACLRLLAGQPLDHRRRRLLGQFIDIYLPLNARQARDLEQELQAVQPEERRPIMEMLSSWEIKGRAEGRAEGQRDIVIRQLQRKLGLLPEALLARVEALPSEQFADLGEALLDFAATDDLVAWLDTHLLEKPHDPTA